MNKAIRDKWVSMLETTLDQVSALKMQSLTDFQRERPVGCHPITDGLAAIESMIWALADAVKRWPTASEISAEQQREMEFSK